MSGKMYENSLKIDVYIQKMDQMCYEILKIIKKVQTSNDVKEKREQNGILHENHCQRQKTLYRLLRYTA